MFVKNVAKSSAVNGLVFMLVLFCDFLCRETILTCPAHTIVSVAGMLAVDTVEHLFIVKCYYIYIDYLVTSCTSNYISN